MAAYNPTARSNRIPQHLRPSTSAGRNRTSQPSNSLTMREIGIPRPRHISIASSNNSDRDDYLTMEPFKFLSGNCEQIRIRQNYTLIEATVPTSNFVYFARCLTYEKSFCVSVAKVLHGTSSNFSFTVGFTTCSTASILTYNLQHLTKQCWPTGCGGHSQQVKIFNANVIGSKVTFERQADGEIYFAINSAMPIRVQFDINSCDINLAKHELLVPYVQLCGNVLSLKTESRQCRKLNISSAIAVRSGQPLGTATAFGPRVNKSPMLPTIPAGQAHHTFVASSDFDTKFVELIYPKNDVKLSINRLAVLRKNDNGDRFVFYLEKELMFDTQVTVQVTKVYNADKYINGFEFGVTTACVSAIKLNERLSLLDSTVRQSGSYSVLIKRDIKLNDKFTFTRCRDGSIEITKNGIVQRKTLLTKTIQRTEKVLPFIILNGTVSGIIVSSATSGDKNMEFGQNYNWPPIEFETTENVSVTHQTLLSWNTHSGQDGIIVNAKPFNEVLKFIIREVQTSATNSQSLTLGLINVVNTGFKTPREISSHLDVCRNDLIKSPAIGLMFSLYKTRYGKVTLKFDDVESDPLILFMVDPQQQYYPVLILNGTVVVIEILPNPSNKTVKYVSTSATTACISRPSETQPTNDCKICMDCDINSVFVPCGHRFACYNCAKEWMRKGNEEYGSSSYCPVCRKKIDHLLQTFE